MFQENHWRDHAQRGPPVEILTFGDNNFIKYEENGVKQVQNVAFVLVTGGVGECPAYNGQHFQLRQLQEHVSYNATYSPSYAYLKTKPLGHDDVHSTLYSSALLKEWYPRETRIICSSFMDQSGIYRKQPTISPP